MNRIEIKRKHLEQTAEYRRCLLRAPELRFLFLELTLDCNQYCKHCGSSCGDVFSGDMLTADEYRELLRQVKEDFGTQRKMLCITGGEPLLRREFFETEYAAALGFSWGMTSNASLIDRQTAHRLYLAGMKTISVSIDGLEASHDSFRRVKGAYRSAMRGIENLINENGFKKIQITSVITHENIGELDAMFDIFSKLDIDSWRVINLEPIGRAKSFPELLLSKEEYLRLFSFIKEKRAEGWPVTYGCSHYLGVSDELETRDWYFLCTSGLFTASIAANGDILGCLDIERRPELIQGSVRRDRFSDVWRERFTQFRDPGYRRCGKCAECEEYPFCGGDSFHTWNFDEKRPELCFKDILF